MMARLFFWAMLWLIASVAIAVAGEQSKGEMPSVPDTAAKAVAFPNNDLTNSYPNEENESPPRSVPFDTKKWAAVKEAARDDISLVQAEINALEERADEPQLQREIERIKLDAEMARLEIALQEAEKKEAHDLAEEIRAEIEHLATLDEPVVGFPQEQPAR